MIYGIIIFIFESFKIKIPIFLFIKHTCHYMSMSWNVTSSSLFQCIWRLYFLLLSPLVSCFCFKLALNIYRWFFILNVLSRKSSRYLLFSVCPSAYGFHHGSWSDSFFISSHHIEFRVSIFHMICFCSAYCKI